MTNQAIWDNINYLTKLSGSVLNQELVVSRFWRSDKRQQ